MNPARWALARLLTFALVAAASPVAAQQVPPPGPAPDPVPQIHYQNRNHWQVGYVVNAPTQLMGFGTVFMGPALRGWGVYADVKTTLGSPTDRQNFTTQLTVDEAEAFGDAFFSRDEVWTSFDLALVRVVSPNLALYAGAGYGEAEIYREYFDRTRTRGELGFYWLEDRAASGPHMRALGGVLFRAGENLSFHFGLENRPEGFTVGASFRLPFIR